MNEKEKIWGEKSSNMKHFILVIVSTIINGADISIGHSIWLTLFDYFIKTYLSFIN